MISDPATSSTNPKIDDDGNGKKKASTTTTTAKKEETTTSTTTTTTADDDGNGKKVSCTKKAPKRAASGDRKEETKELAFHVLEDELESPNDKTRAAITLMITMAAKNPKKNKALCNAIADLSTNQMTHVFLGAVDDLVNGSSGDEEENNDETELVEAVEEYLARRIDPNTKELKTAVATFLDDKTYAAFLKKLNEASDSKIEEVVTNVESKLELIQTAKTSKTNAEFDAIAKSKINVVETETAAVAKTKIEQVNTKIDSKIEEIEEVTSKATDVTAKLDLKIGEAVSKTTEGSTTLELMTSSKIEQLAMKMDEVDAKVAGVEPTVQSIMGQLSSQLGQLSSQTLESIGPQVSNKADEVVGTKLVEVRPVIEAAVVNVVNAMVADGTILAPFVHKAIDKQVEARVKAGVKAEMINKSVFLYHVEWLKAEWDNATVFGKFCTIAFLVLIVARK